MEEVNAAEAADAEAAAFEAEQERRMYVEESRHAET